MLQAVPLFPPSPQDSDLNVEYYSESFNKQGLDNTQHLEKISQHPNELIYPVESLNVDTVSDLAILNTCDENIGGGGKLDSVEYFETEHESVFSDTSCDESSLLETENIEVESLPHSTTITVSKAITLKVGEKVEFFCESDREWQKGTVESVKFDSGHFVECFIKYWAFGKSRVQKIYNEQYLKNFG